jgi:hypothetical protein
MLGLFDDKINNLIRKKYTDILERWTLKIYMLKMLKIKRMSTHGSKNS